MSDHIELRDIPHSKNRFTSLKIRAGTITTLTGPSGSGKTSILRNIHNRSIEQLSGILTNSSCTSPYQADYLPPVLNLSEKGAGSVATRTLRKIRANIFTLFATQAAISCPSCGTEVSLNTVSSIAAELIDCSQKIVICSLWEGSIPYLINRGYYFYIDNGEKKRISSRTKTPFRVIVDRIRPSEEGRNGITDALKRATGLNSSSVIIIKDGTEKQYNLKKSCPSCNTPISSPSPDLFDDIKKSCSYCKGEGVTTNLDYSRTIDRSAVILEHMIIPLKFPVLRHYKDEFFANSSWKADDTVKRLSAKKKDLLLNYISDFLNNKRKSRKISNKFINKFYTEQICSHCKGTGINPLRYSYRIDGITCDQFMEKTILNLAEPGLNYYLSKLRGNISDYPGIFDSLGISHLKLNTKESQLNRRDHLLLSLASATLTTTNNSLILLEIPGYISESDRSLIEDFLKTLKARGNFILLTCSNNVMDNISDSVIILESQSSAIIRSLPDKTEHLNISEFEHYIKKDSDSIEKKILFLDSNAHSTLPSFLPELFNISLPPATCDTSSISYLGELLRISHEISEFYASLPAAKDTARTASLFSLSSSRGKCPLCYQSSLSDSCPQCGGDLFAEYLSDIKYNGKNIATFLRTPFSKISTAALPVTTEVSECMTDLGYGHLSPLTIINHLSEGEREHILSLKSIIDNPTGYFIIKDEEFSSAHNLDKVRRFCLASIASSHKSSALIISSSVPPGCKTDILLT